MLVFEPPPGVWQRVPALGSGVGIKLGPGYGASGDAQVLQEVAAGVQLLRELVPQAVQAVEHGVDGEGQQVEHHQLIGEASLARSQVALEPAALPR